MFSRHIMSQTKVHCLSRYRFHLLIALVALLFLIVIAGCNKKNPSSAQAQTVQDFLNAQESKKILVLHSYHIEYEWVRAINRGINLVLAYNSDYEIQYFYMDTKRRTDDAWKRQVASDAMDLINTWQPDVIIASDDNAQSLVGQKIAARGYPAWVFCGVNSEAEKYGYPTDNATGVLERLHFIDSLQFFKELKPDARKVVFISDYSPTSKGAIEYCQNRVSDIPTGLEVIDWVMPKTMNEWKQTIKNYMTEVDAFAIYTYHTVKKEGLDVSVDPKEVMEWTVNNSPVPIIGFLSFSADHGAFCGVYESATRQGKVAAEMARDILNGTQPGDILITTPKGGQTTINMNIVRKLNIDIQESILQKTDLVIDH